MSRSTSSTATRVLLVAVLLIPAFAGGAFVGWRVGGPPDLSRWDASIERVAEKTGVEAALLKAMVAAESGGRANVTSPKGAHGLLQVIPDTAREEARRLGLGDLDDEALRSPETNLLLGASYMARLLRRYDGSEAFALAAYNAGPTAVNRWRERQPHRSPMDVILREGYAETRRHVVRVLEWRRHYR